MNNTTQLNRSIESSRALLDAVYQNLGYQSGELLNATPSPKPDTDEAEAWLEKGDWLALAEKVKAEKVFFVENDPVIVFCEVPDNEPLHLLETFRRVWCMARPQCLFIASPGELKVYSLNHHPAQGVADWKKIEPLDIIQRIADVSEKLQAYRREQVESGQFFHERNFGKLEQRADKRLIQDLKVVRQSLLNINPKIERYIHALIGRSIFVRYLEDRGILTPEYFENVAENANQPEWVGILQKADEKDLAPNSAKRRYSRVLRNKEFTYALFNQLADHFNGDMFAHDLKEARAITQEHLDLLRGFLLGDTDTQQQKLFLWAYDFEIVPIELVSSIYEEFYHSPVDKQKNDR
ncbi:N-6 DNA methylase, partial [Candidatus Poribacteria bacterium]|nr:N-6 DNA methylase [Candidatus Poribacteria bacterium]